MHCESSVTKQDWQKTGNTTTRVSLSQQATQWRMMRWPTSNSTENDAVSNKRNDNAPEGLRAEGVRGGEDAAQAAGAL